MSKRFGGVQALRAVDLEIVRGSIHGLVGENGAGKSTLGKIITGVHRPDAGRLEVDGEPVAYSSPRDALDDGLALIAQELSLVPQLSVMENVLLGAERHRAGVLDRASMRRRFKEFDELGFGLPMDAPVGSLRAADQQKVEVLRAVARDASLIVMDEPTSSLTADEAERLYDIMRDRAAHGTTVVFVSHQLDAVLRLCDTVTTLRDGRIVRTSPAGAETSEKLVRAMIGRSLDTTFPPKRQPPADSPVVLEVSDLSAAPLVKGVSFSVRRGEILGIAGLIGSGRSEMARAIYGADRVSGGTIRIDGREVRFRSPREAVRHGLVMLPESRKEQGLVLRTSVTDNVTLPHLGELHRLGVVERSSARRRAAAACEEVGVKGAPLSAPVASLSGGNQQKVLFAKWLFRAPKVLIADEPTRGVDVGAKRAIYDLIVERAAAGLAVIVISSELEEILGLAHRVVVMREGRLAGELTQEETTEQAVLHLAFGTATPTEATG